MAFGKLTHLTSNAGADHLAFRTSDYAAAERFPRYSDFYGAGVEVVQIGEQVEADIQATRLDGLMLFDRRVKGVGVERSAATVRSAGFDHFTLQLNRTGEFHVEGADGFGLVRPGELVLLDMAKPMRTRMPDTAVVTVSLGRDLVAAAANAPDRLHGRVLSGGGAGLLGDFLVSLARRAGTLDTQAKSAVAQTLVDLLRPALGVERSADEPARARLDAIRLEMAQRFIEANLGRPDLMPDAVAAAAGLSRATLYRLFEPCGGVAKYVQARRLLLLRAALQNPLQPLPFAALAHAAGFASESHASRSFHKAYGLRPGDFRHAAKEAAKSDYGEAATLMKSTFASWRVELGAGAAGAHFG